MGLYTLGSALVVPAVRRIREEGGSAEKLLRSPPATVRSWPAMLKTMAVNASIDRLRRRRDWSDLGPPDEPERPDQAAIDHQHATVLRQAIAALSDRDAALFGLHYFGDLSHAAIADQMDMNPNAVGVAMHPLSEGSGHSVEEATSMPLSFGTPWFCSDFLPSKSVSASLF